MVFKIDPPYGNQADAQKAYDKKAANLTAQGYTMSSANIGNNTISGTGTKTTDVKAPKAISGGVAGTPWENKMKSLLRSGVSYKGLAEMGHGYEDALKKRFPGEFKPKTTEEKINVKTVNETKVTPTKTETTETKTTNTKTTPDPSKTTETTTDPSKTGILPIGEGGTSTKKATKKNRTAYSGPEKVDTTPGMTGGGGSSDYSHDMKLVKTDVVA